MILGDKPCPKCDGSGRVPDGTSLARFRAQMGLTMSALAHKLGVAGPTLHQIESGERPIPARLVAKLTALYGHKKEDKS
jgi:transcriptional regulator with XRE-family HTH domain